MSNKFELELQCIQYDKAAKSLRDSKDLTMDGAVEALDVYCSCLLQSLLINDEDSLQKNSGESNWFVYRCSIKPAEKKADITIRTTNVEPVQEITCFCTEHLSNDPNEQGRRLILRTNEIISGVYHENEFINGIKMADLAEGIEPDGEWVSTTENGVTWFMQYPWQARVSLGNITVETSKRHFAQTERQYSERYRSARGYSLFWLGEWENLEYVPIWNHQFASDFFKQVRHYANVLRPIIFGSSKENIV